MGGGHHGQLEQDRPHRRPHAREPVLRLHARAALPDIRGLRRASRQRDQPRHERRAGRGLERRRHHPRHHADARPGSRRAVDGYEPADLRDGGCEPTARGDDERLRPQLPAADRPAAGELQARQRDALLHAGAGAGDQPARPAIRGVRSLARLGAVPDLAQPFLRPYRHSERLCEQRAAAFSLRDADHLQPVRRDRHGGGVEGLFPRHAAIPDARGAVAASRPLPLL